MQKSIFGAMAFAAMMAAGCQKDVTSAATVSSKINSQQAALSTDDIIGAVTKISMVPMGTNYGVLIDAPEVTDVYSFENSVAGALGVSCVRDLAPVPGVKKVKMLTSPYNILLNFTGTAPKPSAFRTDITSYQNDLRNVLSSLSAMPTMAVIENEEANKKYYSGSASDYIKQLKAAISVMHSYGIPVTNGGITMIGLRYLVYQDYLDRGMVTEANDYRTRMRIPINNADTKERAAFVSLLLSNYANMDLDYINFHWYSQSAADAQALGETIAYLQRVTGKPVITNEMGQHDSDPATLTATVSMCASYKLPFLVWYSGDADGKSHPLNDSNGALTPTGEAYKKLIQH